MSRTFWGSVVILVVPSIFFGIPLGFISGGLAFQLQGMADMHSVYIRFRGYAYWDF